jgi:DNA-binding CsgD family transcriptional regulator
MWRLEVWAVMREMTLEEMAMVCGGADGLSPRQVDCLLGVANGLGSAQIGRDLGLSPRTVDHYVADACARLEARNRVQAVQIAARRGLLEPLDQDNLECQYGNITVLRDDFLSAPIPSGLGNRAARPATKKG